MAGNGSNGKIRFTPEGGYAIKVINDTGANSVKGTIMEASKAVDEAVILAGIDDPDPMGIMYSDGIADGEEVWVVVSGIAEVLYSTAVTRGTFARVPETGDASATAGYAIAEALPAPPFATNKHFQELGHPLESIGAPGLAKTIIHFN
jgi:hypothetical protein